jgi:transcriptional regulator with XRE-family HTH domain
VRYAQGFALRLESSIGDRPVRDVARASELSHSTLLAILRGERWPDMVTIAKLEEALHTNLWPGPEIRKKQRRAP